MKNCLPQNVPALPHIFIVIIFISAGFPFFVPLYLPQLDWTIYGPRGIAKTIQETLSGQMQHDYFPVRLGDMGSRTKYRGLCEDTSKGFWLGDEGAPTSIKVTSKYLNHSVLTLGYKLEEFARIQPEPGKFSIEDSYYSNGKHISNRGVSVAYITDHEPFDHSLAKGGFVDSAINTKSSRLSADHSHAQFFRDVDILFHDAQYLYSEYSPSSGAMSKEYWGHSTVEYVVEVAFYANVKKLLLFHHDPQRSDDQMDDLVIFARNKVGELEREFGDHMASLGNGPRVPMEVIGSKEGDVFELDPFIFTNDNGIENRDSRERRNSDVDSVSTTASSLINTNFDNQIVLFGFCQTDPKPICNVSENIFDVTVVHKGRDILDFAKSRQPSVIILDEILVGSTAFEVCEEIRNMGAWGEYVNLIIIAAPKNDAFDGEDGKNSILERLNVGDYIQGHFSPSYLLTRIQVSLLRMPLRWRRAPFPSHEPQRLLTLQNTGLLDSNPEERFDRITRLCSAMFNAPISAMSLVDKDRQWFKSIVGLPGVTETPRDHAFCAHAILQDGVMVVPDAMQDERFADNPLVDGEPKIRFYAGCPIRVSSSYSKEKLAIGTLCIIDYKPRDLCAEELQSLKDFGAMLEHEISMKDENIE
jgi:ribonuclease BN (tRNA processing enzyme)/CheY-like chemotaxis protein